MEQGRKIWLRSELDSSARPRGRVVVARLAGAFGFGRLPREYGALDMRPKGAPGRDKPVPYERRPGTEGPPWGR